MLAFPSNHYKDKIRSRKSTPKLSAYRLPSKYVKTPDTNGIFIIKIVNTLNIVL